MKQLIILLGLLSGCTTSAVPDSPIVDSSAIALDSIVEKSKKLTDSTSHILHVVDEKADEKIKVIIEKVYILKANIDTLNKENNKLHHDVEDLQNVIKVTKSTIVRDTIFITEKKNFWGKSKISKDSSQSIIVEDSIQQH
jgi:peptidoglycan hydrolase CwlO-like protein